ncbi:TetR/AcrR family transcriptional regulator [Nocardia sp. NPDC058497]|uniref:TetR/AcrR family transcriptional regulator n=1 Tax=Nocardia sp. NPDC058497 TaxID=3346529 RepID=UPI003664CEF6
MREFLEISPVEEIDCPEIRGHRRRLSWFLERGIDDVTAEDIAAAAGCSRATMYRYVGEKPRLVRAVMVRAAGTIVRVVLSLLTWPLPDAAAERQLVERFVGPALRAR